MMAAKQSTSIDALKNGNGSDSQPVATMRPKDQVKQLLAQHAGQIRAAMPKHLDADRLLKVAQQAVTTTPALLECYVPSLLGGIMQCAMMGLEPNTVLGHAYLIPFNNRKKNRKDVQVIPGYKGLIDLARRSGHVVSIAAHAVRENDHCDVALGTDSRIEHRWDWSADRGEIVGFYAVATFKDGGHAFEVMTRAEVDKVRDGSQGYQMAKRYNRSDSPWMAHYEQMGRKTVIRRLANYLPLSIEFQTAVQLDHKAETGQSQDLGSVLDGEWSAMPDDEVSSEPAALEHAEPEVIEREVDEFEAAYAAAEQAEQPAK